MSTLIKLRRSAVPGRVPTTGQLEFGEIAINTADGKFFIKKFDSAANTEVIVEFSADPNDLLALIKTVDGANSGLDADLLDGLDSTQFLRSDEDDTLNGSLIITGDLTVSGNTTYVNTETINLADNIITLNANHTGNPSQNAGLEVERGTANNVTLQWNEAGDYWEIASGGVLGRIITTGDEGAGNGFDADTLDGEEGTYYLDYNNFFNVPPATLDLTLDGKVTGTAFSNTGIMTLTTELANTGVVPGTYGTPSQIPVITIDEDGRITSASNTAVAGVDNFTWDAANNQLVLTTGDGSVYNIYLNQFKDITVEDLTANSVNITNLGFDSLDVEGDISANNIHVTGLIDGRDIAADGAKLDLLEDGLDLTLTGKVTGTAFSNTGVMTLATELANTGVTSGTYGSASQIPIITVDEDGRLTLVSNTAVAGVDNVTWYTANSTLSILTGDGSVFKANIDEFDEITVNGDIIVSGLVDGRDVAADGAKLDRIEEDITIDLQGKVTGKVTSNTGVLTVQTELANTGVTSGQYGSGAFVPQLTVDEDGRITNITEIASPAGTTVASTDWDIANNTLQIYLTSGQRFNQLIDQFTGLDADTVDGQHAADIIASAASNVGNANIIIEANTGLIGSGSFTLNQFANTTITVEHADTSDIADISLFNTGQVIQAMTFDQFGHVLTANTTDFDTRFYTQSVLDGGQLDNRYYTKVLLDGGQLDNRYYTEAELNLGALDGRYFTETELQNGALDGRYYTENESDARFVNVAGDTMTGDLAISANLDVTGTITAGVIDRNPNITIALTGDIAGTANTTLTNLGDGTISIATTVQADSVALGTDTTGDYVESISNTDGIIILGTTGEGAVPIIGHADTSSVANVNTAFKDVISSMDFDQFGHVIALTTRTMDFLTVQEADARYVNITGDTMSGNLDIQATLTVQDDILQSHAHYVTESVTKTSQNAATLFEFPFATYNSAEVVITATEGINRHITKLLIVHDDTTASATEFGSIATGSNLASYEVSIIGANVRITVTPAQSASTVFKIAATLIVD